MKKPVVLYKPEAKTPLDMVNRLKMSPKYSGLRVGYAGRLDPMAEGIMLLLVGDQNKDRKAYERLAKTYYFEVLFGVSSDTHDILGIPQLEKNIAPRAQVLGRLAKGLVGKFEQAYPAYSSVRVNGKPLYWWARQGKLGEISIPKKEIKIATARYDGRRTIQGDTLLAQVKKRIKPVRGDFRQETILQKWDELLLTRSHLFVIASFTINCSSGTYVRSLASQMGKVLGSGAIALRIIRTRVGNFSKAGV